MCVYNGERYLESAIRSLLNQTFKDFELIVIDDGSTDSTPGLLKRIGREDSRIRVVRQGNRLGQIFIQAKLPGDAAADLRDFQRMRQPRPVVVARLVHQHLRLVHQPPKSGAVHDPVAIPLI